MEGRGFPENRISRNSQIIHRLICVYVWLNHFFFLLINFLCENDKKMSSLTFFLMAQIKMFPEFAMWNLLFSFLHVYLCAFCGFCVSVYVCVCLCRLIITFNLNHSKYTSIWEELFFYSKGKDRIFSAKKNKLLQETMLFLLELVLFFFFFIFMLAVTVSSFY